MKLLIGGAYLGGVGYPNARNTINILRSKLQVEIIDCSTQLPAQMQLWRIVNRSRLRQVAEISNILVKNFLSLCRVKLSRVHRKLVYVPYPSIFFMLFVSFLPKRSRVSCVVDAYIPMWNALVEDRRKMSASSIFARLLYKAERRALRSARLVLVDTVANKQLLCSAYNLEADRVKAFPLAIEEVQLQRSAFLKAYSKSTVTKVLFIGTFIPLHGTQVIARAISQLRGSKSIQFRIVGDGQESTQFANILEENNVEVDWHRKWMDSDEIYREIEAADVCLGVFGGSAKAAHVFPLKLYQYAAAGKPVITQTELSMPEDTPPPPFMVIDPSDINALSNAVSKLANSQDLRLSMGREIKEYYETYLSHSALAEKWRAVLLSYCD